MRVEQTRWTVGEGWVPERPGGLGSLASLVLAFGCPAILRDGSALDEVRASYPGAPVFGCSTAGEILGSQVFDESLAVTAIAFEHTTVRLACTGVAGPEDSFAVGQRLAAGLQKDGLAHVLVLSDGLHVNGTELVRGLASGFPPDVTVTGGLAADADRFQETLVVGGQRPEPRTAAVVGLYGDRLRVGCGTLGGWDSFGAERRITRAKGNVLFELDGRSALSLYKEYLGPHAAGLPATGLLFPLSLRREGEAPESAVVRTILSIDEADQSLTFAGDVPEGSWARLMKANFDRLIDGAVGAAERSLPGLRGSEAGLALLISCVGRKMVLRQRIEEEVEGVREVVGDKPAIAGFYSYGEISPFTPSDRCALHNQTMTITLLSED